MLSGIHDLPLFVAAGLLLNITPGADMALIGARSAAQGFRSGAAAALGVGAGCFVHVGAGALGLSALIASSATAFTVLRWIGAAYLVWLGIGLLRGSAASPAADGNGQRVTISTRRSFAQGFLTNALNPKVALFFLAFLPQFIDSSAANKALAFVVLGVVFAFNGTLVNVAFAAVVARVRGAVSSRASIGRWLGRGVGALFIALGVRLAWFDTGGR